MSNLTRNVNYLDLDKGPRSHLNIVIEIPSSDLIAVIMFVLSVTISNIFAVKIIHDHDLYMLNRSLLNAYIFIENSI